MTVQPEIDFTVHTKENNPESQARLDENMDKWSHQCKIIFEALKAHRPVNNEEPMIWDDSINRFRKIGHLPRRIADLKELIKRDGLLYEIKDGWLPSGFKYYYLKGHN